MRSIALPFIASPSPGGKGRGGAWGRERKGKNKGGSCSSLKTKESKVGEAVEGKVKEMQ